MAEATAARTKHQTTRIPVCTPTLDGNERAYVLDCMETNWVSSLGSYLPKFEDTFSELSGAKHGVSCSSGTAAIHLALEALNITTGDEVIIPAFTLIVSANMVCLAGAIPVLADVCPDTWCIDPAKIEEKITPRTKAIMVVHMYGQPCEMDAILEIARRHNLRVIEDAAQAHGATYQGQVVGGIGDVGVFSFYGNKILTTGEGGMLVTNDEKISDRAKLLRNQAFEKERFVHNHVGFNYRMTNVQAAIGLAQCEKLPEKLSRKREIAANYFALLGDDPDIQIPVSGIQCEPVFWMFGVVLKESFGTTMHVVREKLAAKRIETRAFFVPMHQQPVYQGSNERWPNLCGDYPVSEMLGRCGLYLPTGLDLSIEDQEWIVECLLRCKP